MSPARPAFKTNNEDYFEAFEATDAEPMPSTRRPSFGLLVLAALGLAVAFAVGLAVIH